MTITMREGARIFSFFRAPSFMLSERVVSLNFFGLLFDIKKLIIRYKKLSFRARI